MSEKKGVKNFLHDSLFHEVYSHPRYCLDIFRLVFTSEEFSLFNWDSLKSEMNVFIDSQGVEKRVDLIFSV